MLDLQPIKARLAAATPGPWSLGEHWPERGRREVCGGGLSIATPRDWEGHKDAGLIANAPADLTALVAEVERLTAENDSQEARICHLLDEADKRIDADIRQRNTSIGRPADTVRNIDRLQAEVERLRGAIEAHRASLDTGDGLIDDSDRKLWEVLDA